MQVIKDLLATGDPWELDLCGPPTELKLELVRSLRQHVNITVGRPGVYGRFTCLP